MRKDRAPASDSAHKARTRARVLKAAVSAIRQLGPQRIGVAGVMAKAGLTHGGFYFHFASRDALLEAAVSQMFDEGRERFFQLTEGKSPADALRAYVDYYLSPEHRDQRSTGCPLPPLAVDIPRLGSKARDRFSRGVAGLVGAVAVLLEAHGIANSDAVASSTLSELMGALTLARAVSDRAQSDAILMHARSQLFCRLELA